MKFEDLLERAAQIRRKYDELNQVKRGVSWDGQDIMAGFVGDIGELSTIIMAKNGLRDDVDDVDEKLAHELADCLWSILVLAQKYNVDLAKEFNKTMGQLDKRISQEMEV